MSPDSRNSAELTKIAHESSVGFDQSQNQRPSINSYFEDQLMGSKLNQKDASRHGS